jgi:Protein of unknown function (DUF3619)
MNPEEYLARQICRTLDRGTLEIDPVINERLRAARERALARRIVAAGNVEILGAGGAALRLGGNDERHPVRSLFAILALLLGVSLAYYWNAFEQAGENEEIDSALLADDLPPKAYLDPGFQAWLSHYAQSSAR